MATICLAAILDARADVVWRAQDRGVPAELIVVTPTRLPGPVPSSELRGALLAEVRSHTGLDVREMVDEQVGQCGALLACLSARLDPETGYVLILRNVTDEESNALKLQLVQLGPMAAGGIRPAEVVVDTEEVEVLSATVAASALKSMVEGSLRSFLEPRNQWEPWGSIVLKCSAAGAQVSLDGRPVGVTPEAGLEVRIEQVRTGERALRVEHEGFQPSEIKLHVGHGVSSLAEIVLERPSGPGDIVRPIAMAAGALSIAVGIGFIAAALSADRSGDCISLDSSRCPIGGGFKGSSDFGGFLGPKDELRTGGVLLAPLGYSIAVAGLSWLGAALWLGKAEDAPWWAFAGGLVVGAAVYAVSEASNERSWGARQ